VKTPQTLAILKGLPKKKDAKYRVSTLIGVKTPQTLAILKGLPKKKV
jgi:hypothetical protein